MRVGAIILLFLFRPLAAGCDRGGSSTAPSAPPQPTASTQPVSTTQPTARAEDRLDVLEAVFRHQFNKNASARPRNVEYFFLSLDANADPPPELLSRFKDVKPVVLPVSLVKASPDEGVVHKDFGGRGLIYQMTSVAWLDADTAEVEGGHYAGLWSASGNTYRVTRTNGVWKVTSEVMNWIS